MTDREIMHKLLDEVLDSGNMSAIYMEFFPESLEKSRLHRRAIGMK